MRILAFSLLIIPFLIFSQDNEEIRNVEVPANFRNDIKAWNSYLSSNIRYPRKARKEGLEGDVVVEFIVEKNGELSSFRILPTSNEILGKELIRVLSKSPRWNSGKQRNENGELYAVRQKMSQAISFSLPSKN